MSSLLDLQADVLLLGDFLAAFSTVNQLTCHLLRVLGEVSGVNARAFPGRPFKDLNFRNYPSLLHLYEALTQATLGHVKIEK